jgi:7,8-dihydroneopterin aldolase/epimerase/oxygenase
MWYVKLVDVKMRANHGIFKQETILGNDFIVNISVGFKQHYITQLDESVDYSLLYAIAKKQMDIPTKLLEEVISNICKDIETQIPVLTYIKISIQKLNPAFGSQVTASEVVLEKVMEQH